MAWEKRNGRYYFYLSQRDGHRVRKIYVGKGDDGRSAELVLQIRTEKRVLANLWLEKAAAAYARGDLIDAVLTVELAVVLQGRMGIYMDGRKARRVIHTAKRKNMEAPDVESVLPPEEQATWEQLSLRASRGDRDAAEALLPMLNSNPKLVARWGDLSALALNHWLSLIAGNNKLQREALRLQVIELVENSLQVHNDPLEKSLARRVGLLWLQMTYFDAQVAMAVKRTPREQQALAKRQQEAPQLYEEAIRVLQEYQRRMAATLRSRRPRK